MLAEKVGVVLSEAHLATDWQVSRPDPNSVAVGSYGELL